MIAAAAIVEVCEELEQFEEDRAREAQLHIVDDEVVDVVSSGGDAAAMKTTGCSTTA